MLSKGFIPLNPEVLIEAGIRLMPLIDLTNTGDDVVEAAARRLDAISLKLRLLPDMPETTQALEEFETFMKEFKALHAKQYREGGVIAVLMVVFVIAACLFFGYLLMG